MRGRLGGDGGLLLPGKASAAARCISEIRRRRSESSGAPADFHIKSEVARATDADGRRARRADAPRTTGPGGAMDDGTCARDWTRQCPDGAAHDGAAPTTGSAQPREGGDGWRGAVASRPPRMNSSAFALREDRKAPVDAGAPGPCMLARDFTLADSAAKRRFALSCRAPWPCAGGPQRLACRRRAWFAPLDFLWGPLARGGAPALAAVCWSQCRRRSTPRRRVPARPGLRRLPERRSPAASRGDRPVRAARGRCARMA